MSDRDQNLSGGPDPDRPAARPTPPKPPKPAGWYRDPSGNFDWRYFDGRWTDDVANEGDDQTYIDPVPSPPGAPSRPAQQPAAAVEPAVPQKLWKRKFLKLPLWLWAAGIGVIGVVAIATSSGDDEPESAGDAPRADATSPAVPDPAGTSAAGQVAGDADEADDVRSCSLVDSDTITLDLLNNSSGPSNYMIDVNYLDSAGQRIADETLFVNHVRPGEQVAEQHFVFSAADAASCSVAEVERLSAESPDDLGEVTCEITGVDALDHIATRLTATNGSSQLSDYFISATLMRGGVRVGSVDAVIENVDAGGSAPGDGISTTDGPADGLTCDVVHVERTASE